MGECLDDARRSLEQQVLATLKGRRPAMILVTTGLIWTQLLAAWGAALYLSP